LRVLYGQDYTFKIDSQPGFGAAIHVEIPELIIPRRETPVETATVAES
jgi:hypothetical protein